MTKDNYDKAMSYLDNIERELDKIAAASGHCSFSEWKQAQDIRPSI